MHSTQVRVLTVENFGPMRRIYAHFFKQIGLGEPVFAHEGLQALHMLKASSFDAIISDWHMEPMSGIRLLHSVRARNALSAIPFIMATAEARPAAVRDAWAAGLTAYLVKPFTARALAETLAAAAPQIVRAMKPAFDPGSERIDPTSRGLIAAHDDRRRSSAVARGCEAPTGQDPVA